MMFKHDYDKFYSQCDQTMVGFVQDKNSGSTMKNHNVECFYAVKESSEQLKGDKIAGNST